MKKLLNDLPATLLAGYIFPLWWLKYVKRSVIRSVKKLMTNVVVTTRQYA